MVEEKYVSKWTDPPLDWPLPLRGTFNTAWKSYSLSLGFSLFYPFLSFFFLLIPPTSFTLDLQAPMMTFLFISMRKIEATQRDPQWAPITSSYLHLGPYDLLLLTQTDCLYFYLRPATVHQILPKLIHSRISFQWLFPVSCLKFSSFTSSFPFVYIIISS